MKTWNFYTPDELKPAGWLRRQLEIQANGLSGNLDKIWPDIRDSAWIGGDRDGWERVGLRLLSYIDAEEHKDRHKERYDFCEKRLHKDPSVF